MWFSSALLESVCFQFTDGVPFVPNKDIYRWVPLYWNTPKQKLTLIYPKSSQNHTPISHLLICSHNLNFGKFEWILLSIYVYFNLGRTNPYSEFPVNSKKSRRTFIISPVLDFLLCLMIFACFYFFELSGRPYSFDWCTFSNYRWVPLNSKLTHGVKFLRINHFFKRADKDMRDRSVISRLLCIKGNFDLGKFDWSGTHLYADFFVCLFVLCGFENTYFVRITCQWILVGRSLME